MTITIAVLSVDDMKSLSLLRCGNKFFRSLNRYGQNFFTYESIPIADLASSPYGKRKTMLRASQRLLLKTILTAI